MICLLSRGFITNEYVCHQSVRMRDTNNEGINKFIGISQKRNMKVSSTPSNRTADKVMCNEMLSLAKSFTAVPNRNFTNSTYWDVLSELTTFLNINSTSRNSPTDECGIHSSIVSIFVSKDNQDHNNHLELSSLNNKFMNALDGNGNIELEEDDLGEDDGVIADSKICGSDIEVEFVIRVKKAFNTKVKKSVVHKSVSCNILKKRNW